MEFNHLKLEDIAKEIRKLIIETVYNAGAGHLGGSLSSVEIMTALYFKQMNINPINPNWENRDRFVLSKGHATPLYYSTLALRGYFDLEELKTFDKIDSRLQAHPDMTLLPGIDFSTGSLGQGISGAVGMALAAKKMKKDYKVYCLVGDGETQEGQFWEAINFAVKNKLNNLIIIIDNNNLQQYRDSPLDFGYSKLDVFGTVVFSIDGHNINKIIKCMNYKSYHPIVILANTIKGKGISFMENKKEWHSKPMTKEDYYNALEELL